MEGGGGEWERRESGKRGETERESEREKGKNTVGGDEFSSFRLTLVLKARMRAVLPIPASLPTPRASDAASKSMAARLGMNRSNCGREERARAG